MAQASKTKTSSKKTSTKKSTAKGGKTLAAKQAEIKITQKPSLLGRIKSIKVRSARSGERKELAVSVTTLQALNKWFALFYGAGALATALFAVPFSVPLQLSHLAKDQLLSTASDPVYGFAVTQVGSVGIHWLLATWFALLAIVHGLAATKLRSQVERDLAANRATVGWLLGGVLYGLAAVLLALLVGGYDVALLALIFATSVGAGVAGWLATRTGTWLRAGLVLMTALALVPLAIIKLYLVTALVQGAGLQAGTYITVTTGLVGALLLVIGAWLHHVRVRTFAQPQAWAAISVVLIFRF